METYIYSRVSTDKQSTDAQLESLRKAYPDAHVVTEVASGAKSRPILDSLVAELKAGDRLVVAALDRLGRRTVEILGLVEQLNKNGVILISQREGVDYSTVAGRLVTQILVSVAEMERNIISERTKAGLEAAKSKGKLIGRPSELPDDSKERGIKLVASGWSVRDAAKEVGISPSYLWRLFKSFV